MTQAMAPLPEITRPELELEMIEPSTIAHSIKSIP